MNLGDTGERGPTGDHGQTGAPGQSGNDGKPGDHGQRGLMGERGVEGRPGAEGRVGVTGDTGQAGPTGAKGPSILTRGQTLSLFFFVVIAFLLLAWRSEVNASRIDSNTQQICQARNVATNKLSDLYTGFIGIEKDNPFADQGRAQAAIINRRITLYRQARQDLAATPPCG